MTGPRKKKESATDFIPTPDRQLECSSGFCMTGHHHQCKYIFIAGKCGCDCHVNGLPIELEEVVEIPIEVQEVVEVEEDLIIIEDPRPWRNK